MRLNQAIRRFDPNHDDLKKPAKAKAVAPDPRQMSLIPD